MVVHGPDLWRLIDDYFETRNLNTKLDFYLKPQLETNTLSGVEVNPFLKTQVYTKNRYKPNKSVNPAKYCLEGFFREHVGKLQHLLKFRRTRTPEIQFQ